MNIRKNASGNWQIRMMIDGVSYVKTVKGKKPTEREAYEIILALASEGEKPKAIAFCNAAKDYIKSRENIVSPATVREYTRMIDRLPSWYSKLDIYKIDQRHMQKLVNEISVEHSTKTTHNVHGFCVAVIRFFKPEAVFCTTFKQNDRKEPYIPSKKEVETIIKYSEGTEYHIPLQLAKYSLRRSEICALLKSDLTPDNKVHVCKAKVQDVNKNWVIKRPKTEDSDRYVPIDKKLADEIRALDREEVYPFFPENLTNHLTRSQKKLGMPHFSLHKMRHYFASSLHGIVPEADIQKVGGWKTNTVLRQVYTHSDIDRDSKTRNKILKNL